MGYIPDLEWATYFDIKRSPLQDAEKADGTHNHFYEDLIEYYKDGEKIKEIDTGRPAIED